jgi:hypothetical protein
MMSDILYVISRVPIPWDKAKECEMEELPMIRAITYIRIIPPHR